MANTEENTASKKVSGFLSKNKKAIIIAGIVVIVAVVAFTVVSVFNNSSNNKYLSEIDKIENKYTSEVVKLEGDELVAAQNDIIAELGKYVSKSGIVGSRANLLSAEIKFAADDYESAAALYEAAVEKNKKAYTAPINYYNMGVCYENTEKLDKAEEAYKNAVTFDDFVLLAHAKFSYGRVLEMEGKYAEAVAVYTDLNDKNPDDNWAKIAKTRIIALQAEGKAE